MSSQYVAALVPQIKSILSSSDLSTISAKGVRKKLIASGHEESVIKENRAAIDEKIAQIYETLTGDGQPDGSAQASSSAPRGHTDLSSPTRSEDLEPPSSLPEPLRVKTEVKREVKEERKPIVASLPPARSVAVEETDEQMAARLQREFDAEGSASTGRARRSTVPQTKKKVKRVKKRKAGDGESGDEKPKKRRGGGGGAFNKELVLSDALAYFMGVPRLSRPQCVKRIWDYVKENNLQDPTDKRWIMCDDALRSVFNTDRVHMFTMNKILADHVRDPSEVAFKDEPDPVPGSTGAIAAGSNGTLEVKPRVQPPPIAPVKRDPHALSDAIIMDSGSDEAPDLESEDDDDDEDF